MFDQAEAATEIYKYLVFGISLLGLVVIIASVLLVKRYQSRIVRMNQSKHRFLQRLTSTKLIQGDSREQIILTSNERIMIRTRP